jgi:FkbM family methyltransferase
MKSPRRTIRNFIQRNRQNPVLRPLIELCGKVYRASEFPTYDFNANGEHWSLERCLKDRRNPVILDVGANCGEWTNLARKLAPSATVHAFEIHPQLADELALQFKDCKGVYVHSVGLSSADTELEIVPAGSFEHPGRHSGVRNLRTGMVGTRIKVPVRSGASVCRELGIQKIDYLKIDAEGSDYEVLLGFRSLLETDSVDCIQYEHEHGRYLLDFFELLEPFGYRIGKMYANHVEFKPYSVELEKFPGPNYLAIRRDNENLFKSLKGR